MDKITNVFNPLKMAHAAVDISRGDILYLNEEPLSIGMAARDIREGQAIYYDLDNDTSDILVRVISIVNAMGNDQKPE